MTEIMAPAGGFEPPTYGLGNRNETPNTSNTYNTKVTKSVTSENVEPIAFIRPIKHALLVGEIHPDSTAFFCECGVTYATPDDLEAAGYISLAEHVRIVDEILTRYEAYNG